MPSKWQLEWVKLVLFTPETPLSLGGHTAFREGDQEEPGQDSVGSDTERNLVPRRMERQEEDGRTNHPGSPVQPRPGLGWNQRTYVEASSLTRTQGLCLAGLRTVPCQPRRELGGQYLLCDKGNQGESVDTGASFSKDLFLLMYMPVYCACVTHECGCPQRPEEATESPGAGAVGSCELSYMSLGKEPQVSCNHWASHQPSPCCW